MIPLILKLKKEAHKEIARAQDIVIESLYQVFDKAVIHGGTGIWRCYHGNRFSEDIDVYIPKDLEKIDLFFSALKKKGFIIEKRKVGENSIYSNLKINDVGVRFEAVFKKFNGSLKDYESVESNLMTVYTLTPEEFTIEKVNAYLNRRKIRDLYDIFFLLKYVSNMQIIKKELDKLILKYEKPLDESDLRVLILGGLVPSSDKMIDYVRARNQNG